MKTSSPLILAMAAGLLLAAPVVPAQTGKLEDRLARVERLLDSGALVDLATGQDQVRQAVQELRGELDLLRRDVNQIKQQQRDLYADIDRRLRQLETAGPAPAPTASSVDGDSAPLEPAGTPIASSGDELGDYQLAFNILKSGQYAKAAEAFAVFLQRYPDGQYAANARYWLGESHYVVRDFDQALASFQQVVDQHPDSPKHPDALLKLGFIQLEKGNQPQARKLLEQVRSQFPGTTAAALAEQRLNRLPR